MCRSAAVAFDVDQRDGLYEDVLLPCNAGGQGGGGGGGIMNPRAAEGWGTERRGEGKGGRPPQQAAQGDSETDEQARKRDSESP